MEIGELVTLAEPGAYHKFSCYGDLKNRDSGGCIAKVVARLGDLKNRDSGGCNAQYSSGCQVR